VWAVCAVVEQARTRVLGVLEGVEGRAAITDTEEEEHGAGGELERVVAVVVGEGPAQLQEIAREADVSWFDGGTD
jgi:hypothetical protein